jgi:flagellar motor switch/type III secretory pathway protein FliN
MPLTPEIAPEIKKACETNAIEAADALSRSLDNQFQLTVGETASIALSQPPPDWNGPGLIVVMNVEAEAAVVVLSEAGGLLPNWYRTPDATGKSKLTTLAQELGMLFLPEAFMPLDFSAGYVANIQTALAAGGLSASAGCVALALSAGEKQATLRVVWPVAKPSEVLKAAAAPKAEPTPAAAKSAPTAPKHTEISEDDFEDALANMPPYVRSLLKIQVAVSVHLATTQLPVSKILEIGPGSIIQFKRNCEQPLSLCVGDEVIADGEAVKVGDKFGLRITSMILPGERFFPLMSKRGIKKAS